MTEILPSNPIQERAFYTLLTLAALVLSSIFAPIYITISVAALSLFLLWLFIVQPYVAALVEARKGTDTKSPDQVADHLVEFTKRSGDVTALAEQHSNLVREYAILKERILKLEDRNDEAEARAFVKAVDDDPSDPLIGAT